MVVDRAIVGTPYLRHLEAVQQTVAHLFQSADRWVDLGDDLVAVPLQPLRQIALVIGAREENEPRTSSWLSEPEE